MAGAYPLAEESLVAAVTVNDADELEMLLSRGHRADLWVRYQNDPTHFIPLLAFAVAENSPRIVKLLLDAGAEYEKSWIDRVCTKYSRTAVCWAGARDQRYSNKPSQIEMATLLVDAGADISIGVLHLSEQSLFKFVNSHPSL